jgi:hypothetical protein
MFLRNMGIYQHVNTVSQCRRPASTRKSIGFLGFECMCLQNTLFNILLLFICGLVNDAVNSADNMAVDGRILYGTSRNQLIV